MFGAESPHALVIGPNAIAGAEIAAAWSATRVGFAAAAFVLEEASASTREFDASLERAHVRPGAGPTAAPGAAELPLDYCR